MRIIMAGGGSGGHIFPAIAIADELKKMDTNNEILFIGAKGRLEEKLVPLHNYEIKLINISGFDRSNYRKNVMLPVKFLNALIRCRKIFKQFRPDVVVGTGGFVSGPVVTVASGMKIPFVLQEGNAFPGRVTKAGSKKAASVIVNFEDSARFLKRKNNVVTIPHPIRFSLKKKTREEGLKEFGLNPANRTVFVFGGSQGARGINNAIEKIAGKLFEKDINIIWQTGSSDFSRLSEKFSLCGSKIKIKEFINEMDTAYSAADLIISRAGITSIMEMAYLQIAALLIPLPTAAENHQELNARSLEKDKAAIVILQKDLESKLYDTILNTINNDEILAGLRNNIGKLADPSAACKIAKEIYRIAG